jgi:hydroxybutyrate-dimer hydrolase
MLKLIAPVAALALLAACSSGGGDEPAGDPNVRPAYVRGTIASTTYDGTSDDLLTAGLGKSGLGGAAPTAANPTSPTVAELRRIAIYNNYRALVDITANGGYGSLYGPNVDAFGTPTSGEGKIAGEEHLAFADDGTGRENVTLMVQIPATFSLDRPCIVSATSSGSRGIYGAIGTAGEWGLKKGCAVAYTDKGTGTGYHDLANNAVYVMQGTRTPAAAAGANSIFTANLSATDLAAYNTAFPNRWATKHAHSQQNPEQNWGRDTLRAIEFAFYMLNQKYGRLSGGTVLKDSRLAPENVIVIASSVSNGAGGAIAAAELDTGGLIDGVAVAEPQIFMNPPTGLTIRRGSTTVQGFGKTLYDYFTLANLYQPCAAVSAAAVGSPLGAGVLVNATTASNRCDALAARGLVNGANTGERATDAMNRLLSNGWDPDTTPFHASHYALATLSVTLTYGNAYNKASVTQNLCGYSFGGTPAAGVPAPINAVVAAQLFSTSNGVPPSSASINIINNNAVGGAALDAASVSPSTSLADYNIDGATCLRDLLGNSAGATLRASIDAAKRTGNLRGKPAIIVHGRSDTLVPVNHTSRPYFALNKTVEGANSKLVYYEVKNAQHFDAFLSLAGYDTRLVPLHRYFVQAMDIMYQNLRNGTPIPPSQVVRTVPRGGTPGAAPAIGLVNVPSINFEPPAADQISFSGNTLTIPD